MEGRLMDLMDRQQGRVPPNGWRVPEGERDPQTRWKMWQSY